MLSGDQLRNYLAEDVGEAKVATLVAIGEPRVLEAEQAQYGCLNIVDVDDVATGHLLAMQKGRIGERYILGCKNLMLREVFEILSRLTGIKAPTLKLPRFAVLPLAYFNHWLATLTGRPPRIPLEGVKMAKYKMHYDCSKAIRELGIPQTPPEVALEKAVRWFGSHGYA